ncbi:CHAT domain-containing protein [Amylostereum chailletii]|nr:CHAT domain-containing protein [Amylostereum chailletii]
METIEATIPLLASVLLINPPGIRFIHPSFGDFLTEEPCASNERRSSSQFFISRDNYVERIIAVVHKFNTYLLHDPPVRSGNVTDDLDRRIVVQTLGASLAPDDDDRKPILLASLAFSHKNRFHQEGHWTDIERAISVQQHAINITSENHIDKPAFLDNLGNSLHFRFQHFGDHFGDVADIDSAIHVQRKAVDLTPDGHASKPLRLNNLGNSFHSRFQRSGDAVNLTPKGHPNKPSFLDNLGLSLQARFERLRDVADLDSAIHVQRQAVDLTPDGHADKPRQLNNLGNSLHFRFQRLGETADSHAAVDVYRISANSPSGPPSHRFYAACKWALLLSLPHSTSSPLEAYQVALALVPRVPVWLGYDEKLPSMAEVVSEAVAAAIAVGDLGCAFEWLEEGRCLQLRTPLDDLRAVDPALADYLERISNALDAPGTGRGFNTSKEKNEWPTLEQEARKHHHLAEQYERTVEKARTLPGCEDFLRPKRLANLRAVADSGPVVVVDTERCDALVLLQSSEEVLHIPLPTLNHAEVAHWKDSMLQFLQQSGLWTGESRQFPEVVGEGNPMVGILAKLWSGIVHPILLELKLLEKSTTGDLPHVTWCTTSALGFLPLHAAGIYDDDAGPKIFDFVVSSYTPTLSALLNARRRNDSHSQTPSMLAVSQPRIPGQNALQGTIAEIAAIKKVVGNSGIYLNGEEATRNSVLTAMEDHSWIHLACQAHQHTQDPEQSAFILHDSQLDLLSIVRRSLKHTELAFLSGGSGFTENEVQIATGMFMVGYRSVVATMWPIEDKDAPMVVEEFYSLLMEEGGNNRRKVAYALHTAVKRLRDEVGEKEVMRWASFFHIGI